MSKALKVGDLAQVVRHTCCGLYLGVVFQVVKIESGCLGVQCDLCGVRHPSSIAVETNLPDGRLCWAALSWLKKIDPPALPETVKREEELVA